MKSGYSIGAIATALAVAVAASPGAIQAAAQQYTATVTPLLAAASGSTIGSLGPGAAVTVVGQSGTVSHVTLQGVTAPNAPGFVYTSPARHIVEVSNFSGHAATGSTQAVSGTTYTSVTVDGWVATSALAADQQTVLNAAGTLYNQRCSACHALQPPDAFTANQWPATIKNHSPNPGLTPDETALITLYLQVKAKT
jgi:hypothetical protein